MEIENEKRNLSPLAGPISGHTHGLSPRARDLPPLSAHLRPAPSRARLSRCCSTPPASRTHPCTAPPRRAVPSPPLCTIYADCCAPHPRPPNTAAPLASGAYKRAAPSSSMPCTGLGHSSPPFPSSTASSSAAPPSAQVSAFSFPPLVVQRAIH
jgi:hypothetical protein